MEASVQHHYDNLLKMKVASASLQMDRVEKGIQISGLPKDCDQTGLDQFVRNFGDIVEVCAPAGIRDNSNSYVLYRFKEKESADRMKSIPRHKIPFPGVTVGGWYGDHAKPIQDIDYAKQSLNWFQSFDEQLTNLLAAVTPGDGSMDDYNILCSDIYTSVQDLFPNCLVRPFGSTFTGLALNDSDVDIFVEHKSDSQADSVIISIRNQIYKSKLSCEDMVLITAKTPFVQLLHTSTGLRCYISCKNAMGVMNSHLVRCFVNLDPRIKPLILLIKYWAKFYKLIGLSNQFTSYALTMKAIFYLQQLDNPILPSVVYLQSICKNKMMIDGWECSFASLRPAALASDTRTVADLLCGFFQYYSTFDYAYNVICPLIGQTVAKSVFSKKNLVPKEMATYTANNLAADERLQVGIRFTPCIQDPFKLNHNVAQHVTSGNLERMVSFYVKAAQTCLEVTHSAHLLSKLFYPKLEPKPIQAPPRPVVQKNWNVIALMPSKVVGLHRSDLADDAIQPWFENTYQFLVQILEKLFGLRVLVDCYNQDDSGLGPKKRFKPGMEARNYLPSFEDSEYIALHCRGYYDIIKGRNHAKSMLPETLSPWKVEQLVTEKAISLLKEKHDYEVVDFQCHFVPWMKPLQVVLELHDKDTKKQSFKNWGIFLTSNILKIYYTHFQEFRASLTDPSIVLFH